MFLKYIQMLAIMDEFHEKTSQTGVFLRQKKNRQLN